MNRYFILRHGESIANKERLIVSSLAHGVANYGLTAAGEKEVATSVTQALQTGMLSRVDLIVSSPFLRALQSAKIAAKLLNVPIEYDERLKERYFGEFDMKGDHFYMTVWAHDLLDSSQVDRKVESATTVFERVKQLINDIEIRINNRIVLLCTHGDVASVLLCGFLGEDLRRHREIGILCTGEIRAVPMR